MLFPNKIRLCTTQRNWLVILKMSKNYITAKEQCFSVHIVSFSFHLYIHTVVHELSVFHYLIIKSRGLETYRFPKLDAFTVWCIPTCMKIGTHLHFNLIIQHQSLLIWLWQVLRVPPSPWECVLTWCPGSRGLWEMWSTTWGYLEHRRAQAEGKTRHSSASRFQSYPQGRRERERQLGSESTAHCNYSLSIMALRYFVLWLIS